MEASNYDALEDFIEEIHKQLQKVYGRLLPNPISQSQMRKLKKWDKHEDHYWFHNTEKRLRLYFRVGIEHGGREEKIQWQ